MKRIVKYIAVDPYYSDQIQTYIGTTEEEIDNIQYETEQHMAQFHCNLSMIYKPEIIFDDTMFDFGMNVDNRKINKNLNIIL